MSDDAKARSWQALIKAAHAHSTPVFAQLMHAGALSQVNRFDPQNIAPSAVQPNGKEMEFYYGNGPYERPLAMTDEHIADVIAGFAQAAHRAIAVAGFDGLEIHGANGYLLDQFLTDYSDARDDRWGGNLETVWRRPLKLSMQWGGKWETTSRWGYEYRKAKSEHDALAPAFDNGRHSLSQLAKRFAPGIAIITNGGLHDPARIAQALKEGGNRQSGAGQSRPA